MARITHDIAYRDRQYLWHIGPASDMTGAYVDQGDLERMLENPSKATAVKCLLRQIEYWFQAGTEDGGQAETAESLKTDPKVREIYERYIGDLSHDDEDNYD